MSKQTNWFVIKTKSRFEKKLNAIYEEFGIKTFLPLTKEIRQWSDRKKWVEEPAIRGYIFVHTSEDRLVDLLQPEGAVHILRYNKVAATVSEEEIELIRKIVNNKYRFEVTNDIFEEGDRVLVVMGGFKGYEGVWVSNKAKQYIVVQLDKANMGFKVDIPAAYVKKLEPSAQ